MTTTTINFTAASDTALSSYTGEGSSWAYLTPTVTATVDAANDRVLLDGFSGNDMRVRYTGTGTTTGDQDVTLTCNVKSGNAGGVALKCSAVADTCYEVIIDIGQTNELRLYRTIAGTRTLISSWDEGAIAAGVHTIRGRAVVNGSQVDLQAQLNGGTTRTFSDTDASRLTSGHPGMAGSTDENFTWLDTFILDDLVAGGSTPRRLMLLGVG